MHDRTRTYAQGSHVAYWLDDGFDTWPEVVRAGKAATGLYTCCGAWISRNIGNGSIADAVVPAEVAAMYGTPEWVAKLVAVGLWRTDEAGYRDVKYFTMGNPPADKVAARRKADADRKARWRENRDKSRRDTTRDSGVRHSDSPGVRPLSPALPPLKGEGGAGARTQPGHLPHCPYQDRNPKTCSVCKSERLAPGHLVEQELPLPWPTPRPGPPDEPETATPPPTAPTRADPPTAAPSAPANASAAANSMSPPATSRPTPRRRRSSSPSPSPAPAATPPPPPETTTPAAPGDPLVVHVRQPHGDPVPAELVDTDPRRPKLVKVIYQHSRTAAWIDRNRITNPPWRPPADLWVWITVRRKGIEAHRKHPEAITTCNRSTRHHGEMLSAAEATSAYQATWCATCWPWPTTKETTAA